MLWRLSCDRGCKGRCFSSLQDDFILQDRVHFSLHYILVLQYAEVLGSISKSSMLPSTSWLQTYMSLVSTQIPQRDSDCRIPAEKGLQISSFGEKVRHPQDMTHFWLKAMLL